MDVLTLHLVAIPLTVLLGLGVGWSLRGALERARRGEDQPGDPDMGDR